MVPHTTSGEKAKSITEIASLPMSSFSVSLPESASSKVLPGSQQLHNPKRKTAIAQDTAQMPQKGMEKMTLSDTMKTAVQAPEYAKAASCIFARKHSAVALLPPAHTRDGHTRETRPPLPDHLLFLKSSPLRKRAKMQRF